jgi:hypothetical protein
MDRELFYADKNRKFKIISVAEEDLKNGCGINFIKTDL